MQHVGVYNKSMAWLRLSFVRVLSVCLLVLIGGSVASAASDDFSRRVPLLQLWMKYNPDFHLPVNTDLEEAIRTYKGPVEHRLPKVTFLAFDRPQHIQGRVESLMHGLKITLPAEYDYYGYEIRRYMQSVGRLEIFRNRYAMEEEIVNIEKSWIIFRYWREELLGELDAIDRDLKQDAAASSKVKALFKVNEAIVKAFVIEMQSWINANDDLLKFLADNRKSYTFENGVFLFKTTDDARTFIALFGTRERAKQEMRKYDPFGTIVY